MEWKQACYCILAASANTVLPLAIFSMRELASVKMLPHFAHVAKATLCPIFQEDFVKVHQSRDVNFQNIPVRPLLCDFKD